jgi:hypothetical protein
LDLWFVEGYGDDAERLQGESGRGGPDYTSSAKGITCWVMDLLLETREDLWPRIHQINAAGPGLDLHTT